eukprot:jgi/Mesvir1/13353/Mv16867-RA.1
MSYPVVSLERLMPSETEAGTAEGFWLNLSGSLHNDFEKGTQGFIDKLGRYCLVFNAYDETLEDCHMNRIIDMLFHKKVPFSVEFYRGPKCASGASPLTWRRWDSYIDIRRPEVRVIRAHLERPYKDPEFYKSVPPLDQLQIGPYSFPPAYRRLIHDYCKDFTVYELIGTYNGENKNLPSHKSWSESVRLGRDINDDCL